MKIKDSLANAPIKKQTLRLIEIVNKNPNLFILLNELSDFEFPWYLGAGCINQTVWNYLTDRDITFGIDDYDFVYWDEKFSREKEVVLEKKLNDRFSGLKIQKIDVTNQAGVHTWFEEKFGKKIQSYENLEQAISTWPATATCVGITNYRGVNGIVAPYGLSDLFGMVLRKNHPYAIEKVFLQKVEKWTSKWPELRVI
ncbi:nucleotidyltransferase family protein [Patescibacteria group bacterium]